MSNAGYGPLWRIDGPPPIAQAYGLLQAASKPAAGVRLVTDVDSQLIERWLNGAEVYPYPASGTGIFNTCAPASEAVDKSFGDDVPHPIFGAMTAYLAETCTSYKVWDQEEFKARAVLAFAAVESSLVARELMAGDVMLLNPHLADGQGTFPNGDTATSPLNGLSLLEGEIAASGRAGVIHMSPMMVTFLRYAIDDQGGVLRTANGLVVIADFGYAAGAAPTGHAAAAAGEEWMYATGPIDVRRSDIFTVPGDVSEALDRGTGGATNNRPNSITYRAERYYLVDWDTAVQAAVLVDRCSTTC